MGTLAHTWKNTDPPAVKRDVDLHFSVMVTFRGFVEALSKELFSRNRCHGAALPERKNFRVVFSACFRWEAVQVFPVLLCFHWQKLPATTLKDAHTRKALLLPVLSLQQVHAHTCHRVDGLNLFRAVSVTKGNALCLTLASRRRA